MLQYAIAEFYDGLHLISSTWIEKNELGVSICKWPNIEDQIKINKFVSSHHKPEISWKELKIKKIHGYASDYVKGIDKLKLYQDLSEIDSDDMTQRRELKRKRPEFSQNDLWQEKGSSSSEDELSQSIVRPSVELQSKAHKQSVTVPEKQSYPKVPMKLQTLAVVDECSLTFSSGEIQTVSGQLIPPAPSAACKCASQNEEITKLLKQTLSKANFMLQKMQVLEEKFDSFANPAVEASNETTQLMDQFPLWDIGHLDEFENFLMDDINYRNLVQGLKGIGGTSVYFVVTKILKRVLTHEVAEMFSLVGAKKKRSFKALKFYKAILETTRMSFPGATEEEIGNLISNWLRHAKQRRERAEGSNSKVSITD